MPPFTQPSRLEDLASDTSFPSGLKIYFRAFSPRDGEPACYVIPSARQVELVDTDHGVDYNITDTQGKFLGSFPREYVAAIIPLETVGPGAGTNANQPQ